MSILGVEWGIGLMWLFPSPDTFVQNNVEPAKCRNRLNSHFNIPFLVRLIQSPGPDMVCQRNRQKKLCGR